MWNAVFQTKEWLECASGMNAEVVVIGTNLDILGWYGEGSGTTVFCAGDR
jgi:hypothetical protein